ncbi:hypothetical protein EUGRSUZ_K00074 [Eucalyptus grandis]|uniref:Uncharacterized protein n=2 Tax=Eucalyptus grandis TaxID=71139 RepID=A0ACC3IQL3_EUCGR|nr:hypothetical protein EUGRSUZ_K00074 [Eucalyptus grandis]
MLSHNPTYDGGLKSMYRSNCQTKSQSLQSLSSSTPKQTLWWMRVSSLSTSIDCWTCICVRCTLLKFPSRSPAIALTNSQRMKDSRSRSRQIVVH